MTDISMLVKPLTDDNQSLPKLFIIPESYIRADDIAPMARNLSPLVNIIMLNAFCDKSLSFEEKIEELQGVIRDTQAKGPYLLLGHGAGGSYQFELAGRLEEQGEKVTLILLDANVFDEGYEPRMKFHGQIMLQEAAVGEFSDHAEEKVEALQAECLQTVQVNTVEGTHDELLDADHANYIAQLLKLISSVSPDYWKEPFPENAVCDDKR